MTSSYRLGDIIVQGVDDPITNSEILNEHPQSIGSDYILSMNKKISIEQITKFCNFQVNLAPLSIF